MVASAEQQCSALGSSRVDKLHRSHEAAPAFSKFFCKFLLPRQRVWYGEVVLAENSPILSPRQQVTRVVNGTEHFLQCSKENRLFLTCSTANQAIHASILISVSVHADILGMLVNGSFIF